MIHMQSGVWLEELAGPDGPTAPKNCTATNYKQWSRRFSKECDIPITTYIICEHYHVHTWESVFPNDDTSKPSKTLCGYNSVYGKTKTTCSLPLFRNVSAKTASKFHPIYIYPVFSLEAQLKLILKAPDAYEKLTQYKSKLKPDVDGVRSEIYHGDAFQRLAKILKNDNDKILDIFLKLSLDWAQFSKFGVDKIGPCIVRILNFTYEDRLQDSAM